MTNTKKTFKELSKAELNKMTKDERINYYEARDAHYGVKEGLFRVTHITRHADKHFKDYADAASFGFDVVPAGKSVPAEDFKPNTFVWVNQLVNLEAGKPVIEAVENMQKKLQNGTKSLLVSMKYNKKNGYTNVNAVYER